MILKNMYRSDINRDINGVIKVAQDDERSMIQELSEYIITRELRRHFNTFLDHYSRSIEQPTDKIGVWISGFFGSGKSHFLKILSYLLSNKVVGGKSSVDYFADKFDDPMMFAQLENCAKVPTETILFNIDSKSPITKDKTAILRVFAKVFYEHQGFYGNDLKVAKLEQFISRSGKSEQFRECFERVNGGSWEESRDSFAFFEDDVVEAMCESLDMSETAARNWFNGEEEIELSIESLVAEIKAYIDSKGKNNRLIFMVDEVGQYIGSDSDLMLNLQTIVEEIGTKCGGRVWVMVTSQEAIDSITKISGDDFSKIQGRFDTRLSLSSSSVDEVIKKRILAKNEPAEQFLRQMYEKNCQQLKHLFTFDKDNALLDLKGYVGEGDFIETYPFVPYQFRLMQNVLAEIRKHGNSGKHLSGGERSMLSGFQEVAKAIQDKDEYAVAPFYLFYDTVHTFLESSIRRVIDRCQLAADNHDGIEQYDVNILKLLYLVRYVNDIKSNVDNISVLMADDIRTDKVSTRLEIQRSLDRLVSQNYVSRNGDAYTFLTDDEQDIAREIKNTPVDTADITKAISDIIFGKLFVSKKFKYGKYDFSFDQRIDEMVIGQLNGGMALHFITAASEIYSPDDSTFLMRSASDNEVMVVLAESQPYFNELEASMKIRRYVKSKNVAQLPEVIQSIIRDRLVQASDHEKRAEELIMAAISEGRVYVAGDKLTLKVSSVKERIERALTILVENVYTKLGYIKENYDSDADIVKILTGSEQTAMADVGFPNEEAMKELIQYLNIQKMKQLPTSMADIQRRYQAVPYGWREVDIAAITAQLIASHKLILKHSGAVIAQNDKKVPDYLRRRTEVDKSIVSFRVAPPMGLISSARKFLSEYFDRTLGAVPDDEDGIVDFIIEQFEAEQNEMEKLLEKEYSVSLYPGEGVIDKSIRLCGELLGQKNDSIALLKKLVDMQEELFDAQDDMSRVRTFFKTQRTIFDDAVKLVNSLEEEKEYFQGEDNVLSAMAEIKDIVAMSAPYSRIRELPELVRKIREVYDRLLSEKREEILDEIQAAMAEIHQTADEKQHDIVQRADEALGDKKTAAQNADRLTNLDAMKIQIGNIRRQYMQKLIVSEKPELNAVTINRSSVCHTMKLKSEADIDEYVAEIKMALMEKLKGHDELHII